MKKTCLLLPIVLLCGCTTVQDFREMSPDQRARRVCDLRDDYIRLKNERNNLAAPIRSAQEALARGYRLHKECKKVEVYGDLTTVCKESPGKTVCKEHRPVSYRNDCIDIPIPIDPAQERENIRQWTDSQTRLNNDMQSVWSTCYQWIYNMPPEEAYRYYSGM